MPQTPTPPRPASPKPDDDDELLDEALDETFPASDPARIEPHPKLPPAHAPGSDVKKR